MRTVEAMEYLPSKDGHKRWGVSRGVVDSRARGWRLDRSDLLHRNNLRLVQGKASAWDDGRKARTRQLWADLVHASIYPSTSLGFINIPEGGLSALADEFRVAPSTMAANLRRWRLGDHPMVVAYYGAKRTRHPPLQLVQLPDITDLLVWAALARIPYLTSRVNAPSLGQVTDLLAYFAEHRATPGSPPETYDEAQRLLRRLGVRS
jgi:hypothetical protein